MDYVSLIAPAVTAAAVALLSVVLTKARAAVITRASVPAVLSAVAALLTELASDGFDPKAAAGRFVAIVMALVPAYQMGVEPQLKAGKGPIAFLSRATADFGVGSKIPTPTSRRAAA